MQLPLTVGSGEGTRDVVVDVAPTTTVAELADVLGVAACDVASVDPATDLASSGILAGVVLPREHGADLPAGTVRLEVVGGPFAGESVALPTGTRITLGSGAAMRVRLLDPAVGDHHVTLEVTSGAGHPSMSVHPQGAAVVLVDGVGLTGAREVGPDDVVQVGSSLLRVGVVPASDAHVVPDGVGHVAFNRGARIRPPVATPAVRVPGGKPADRDRTPLPWLAALVPVVLGVTMALALGRYWYLMMALASPLMVVGSYVTSRRAARRSGRRTEETWRQEVLAARAQVARLVTEQRVRRWHDHPDPVAVLDVAVAPGARLWERRATDPDAVTVRVGVADQDLDVRWEGARARVDGVAVSVGVSPSPVTVELSSGTVGVAGPRDVAVSLARAMLVQLAVLRSPRDLRVVLLCEDTAQDDWDWVRWLPHVGGGAGACVQVGNTPATRQARVRELSGLVESRRRAARESSRAAFDTQTVVLLDQARGMRLLPGMVTLLEHGPAVGVFVVALDEHRSRLPQECATEVAVDRQDTTTGEVVARDGVVGPVLLDGTSLDVARRAARALAPVVHVAGVGDEHLLPSSVRLVDLLGVDLQDPAPIVAAWAAVPRSTYAVVGAGADGVLGVDLAEDGPHGLVAGTTGSGKSELLQTLVVSLALVNRPDALTFVLVDYKGGSAFADCERLPHTVGMVTNLDARGTERALESLDAELERRETVLRDLGAKDADAAWERDPVAAAARGLARLVLVIDEFAELRTELPDFVSGLVRIARVGRSLGVHLILATQRPAGQITAEMQANTNLRVALRVTDRTDSTDVLGSGEAASIGSRQPGRGFARRGTGAAPVAFQTARVAGRRPGAAPATTSPRAASVPWERLGLPVAFAPDAADRADVDHDDTDLRAVVDLLGAAAAAAGVARRPSPWLPELPAVVDVDDVVAGGRAAQTAVVLGLEDLPAQQAQVPLEWDVASGSHVAVIGGARSGRTSTLRVVVAQLAATWSPADLHLYALDWGNGALAPMAGLPHCGAVVTPVETGRLERFLRRLHAEVARRQQVLAAGGFGDLGEQRAAVHGSERLAYAVVVLDGWDRLVGDVADLDAFRSSFARLLREAPAVGLRVLLTGDRSLLVSESKVMGAVETRYVLPLTSRDDYRSIGLRERHLPREVGPGRMLSGGARVREAQMALLPGAADGQGQQAAFVERIARARAVPGPVHPPPGSGGATPPLRVDVLPDAISRTDASALPVAPGCPADGVTVAVGGDSLSRYTVDLFDSPGLLVTGDRRTGRSTALAMVLRQLVDRGAGVLVVAPKDSPVRRLAVRRGLPLFTGDDLDADDATFVATGSRATEQARAAGLDRVVVVCDDAELVNGTRVGDTILRSADRLVHCVSVLLDATGGYKGLDTEARKARQALVLSPTRAVQGSGAVGTMIPPHALGARGPGGGVWFDHGTFVQVQVPG
ncbi:FtsK/SpoIIIE domain-containing protein [Cellulosimicrobium arenosum]|uniref:Cell division protein FtsK n=1 Tax=Cellulosimicrobium arenosum TaxID=2708133 RepID=A0A927IYT0_9MICO|nr:FtsK/SpoIIIE domain-containing protein [Cellulosimicrobium arenosum]MBD8078741.1 cell division protein FtsK [Cellulosimicrobium arenosum]